MKKLKFTFKNAAGEELAGLLELPENPKAFALLAHCFTCGKDLKGAARIGGVSGNPRKFRHSALWNFLGGWSAA